MPATPQERLELLLAQDSTLGAWSQTDGPREAVASDSNDVWRTRHHVLRVCWRGDVRRLEREAAIVASLPRELGYPPVAAFGVDESSGMSWMLTERRRGVSLGREAWPTMTTAERRDAVVDCTRRLRTLHEWEVPTSLVRTLEAHDRVERTASEIAEAYIDPVPVRWAETLIDECEQAALVSSALCDEVRHRLAVLSGHDPFVAADRRRVVVHGDLSPDNVLWRGSDDLSLLDFEWCRLGVPDMDLLSFADVPSVDPSVVSGWIHACYPELFAYEFLLERLWLYELVIAIRSVVAWSASPSNVQRLRAVAAQPPEYVRKLLAGAS